MGNGGFGHPVQMTAGRKTQVAFDVTWPQIVQPPFYISKSAASIGSKKSFEAYNTNTRVVEDIGVRLESKQYDRSGLHESIAGQAAIKSVASGKLRIAPNHEEANTQAKPGFPGITYNADVSSSGSPTVIKTAPAGANWGTDQSLAADQEAFPGPEPEKDNCKLDRVAVTTETYGALRRATIRFTVPDKLIGGLQVIFNWYFPGPASSDWRFKGYGQYCLKMYADGSGELFERGIVTVGGSTTENWSLRGRVQFWAGESLVNLGKVLVIETDVREVNGVLIGDKITIKARDWGDPRGFMDTLIQAARYSIITTAGNMDLLWEKCRYKVPHKTIEQIHPCPIRVDVRQDVRMEFQVATASYPTSGVFYDDPFSLDFCCDATKPFVVAWREDTPDNTTCEVKLYNYDTNAELTPYGGITRSGGHCTRSYVAPVGIARFFVGIHMTSDSVETPTMISYEVGRDIVTQSPSLDETVHETHICSINVAGQGKELSTGNATLTIRDVYDDLQLLNSRSAMSFELRDVYDEETGDYTILHSGFVESATGHLKGRPRKTAAGVEIEYPSKHWKDYKLNVRGHWRRLKEKFTPAKYSLFDEAEGKARKITDACRVMLHWAGCDDDMIDFPDRELRFIVSGSNEQAVVEWRTCIADVLEAWIDMYFGGWLCFDENAGTRGMWRLREKQVYPYKILARIARTCRTGKRLHHLIDSQGTATVGGQEIPVLWMNNKTVFSRAEAPEYNKATVYGALLGSNDGNAVDEAMQSASIVSQTVYNTNSYDVWNVGVGNPGYPDTSSANEDYIGRVIALDEFLGATGGSTQMVNWAARRIYDYQMIGRHWITAQLPLALLWDSTDTLQTRPRPLRYYDIVEVQNEYDSNVWEPYIVSEVGVAYEKDGYQWANVTLVRTSRMTQYASLPRTLRGLEEEAYRTVMRRKMGVNYANKHLNASPNYNAADLGRTISENHVSLYPLQDLDPTSSDYGKFYFLPDYDTPT